LNVEVTIDDVLPGVTEAETRQLAPYFKRYEKAFRERAKLFDGVDTDSPRQDLTGKVRRRLDRLPELTAAVETAQRDLEAQAATLRDKRRELLPADALAAETMPADDHSVEERWMVVARTEYHRLALGGCRTLGEAQQRQRWFQAEIERRRAPASEVWAGKNSDGGDVDV
jgi:hypothetical protein